MKWIIILTVIAGISFVILLIRAIINGIEPEPIEGTLTHFDVSDFELGEMFQENDINDYSSEHVISDETIKRVVLRNKLNKIEKERETEIGDVNVNYQNYEGK